MPIICSYSTHSCSIQYLHANIWVIHSNTHSLTLCITQTGNMTLLASVVPYMYPYLGSSTSTMSQSVANNSIGCGDYCACQFQLSYNTSLTKCRSYLQRSVTYRDHPSNAENKWRYSSASCATFEGPPAGSAISVRCRAAFGG